MIGSEGGFAAETVQGEPFPPMWKFLDLGTADRRNGGPVVGAPYVSWWIFNLNPF